MSTFSEIKLFQVKPDKTGQFELLAEKMLTEQAKREGCISVKYMKRFYTIDGVEPGEPPRELTRIVKCVKYYSFWEFDCKEHYGTAIKWFFDSYMKELQRLLILPFDISIGDSLRGNALQDVPDDDLSTEEIVSSMTITGIL